MQLSEIAQNIQTRRNRIFLLMEELRRLRIQQRLKVGWSSCNRLTASARLGTQQHTTWPAHWGTWAGPRPGSPTGAPHVARSTTWQE